MSKGKRFRHDLLCMVFQNVPIPGLTVEGLAGELYVALHTADPDPSGDQVSHECQYSGYERIPVERSADQWDVEGNLSSNGSTVEFGECSGDEDAEDVTHVSVGKASGEILYSGSTGPLKVVKGIQPRFRPGEMQFREY